MTQATEVFVAVTAVIFGLSHLLLPQEWSAIFVTLWRAGRPGAFANGAIHLFPGVVIVAGHWVWTWPEAVLTFLGCVLVIKGASCFLLPDVALRSMSLAGCVQIPRGGYLRPGGRRLGDLLSDSSSAIGWLNARGGALDREKKISGVVGP